MIILVNGDYIFSCPHNDCDKCSLRFRCKTSQDSINITMSELYTLVNEIFERNNYIKSIIRSNLDDVRVK